MRHTKLSDYRYSFSMAYDGGDCQVDSDATIDLVKSIRGLAGIVPLASYVVTSNPLGNWSMVCTAKDLRSIAVEVTPALPLPLFKLTTAAAWKADEMEAMMKLATILGGVLPTYQVKTLTVTWS